MSEDRKFVALKHLDGSIEQPQEAPAESIAVAGFSHPYLACIQCISMNKFKYQQAILRNNQHKLFTHAIRVFLYSPDVDFHHPL